MITLELLLASLQTGDPYDGIDALIRSELTKGRRTREIHADIFSLAPSVRGAPGFTEDAYEALMGALDALTGNCHPDCCYTDSVGDGARSAVPSLANSISDDGRPVRAV